MIVFKRECLYWVSCYLQDFTTRLLIAKVSAYLKDFVFLKGVDFAQATHRTILFQIINEIFIGKPEGKKLLVRPNSRLENNIKMDPK
jgi:hypothetical protein